MADPVKLPKGIQILAEQVVGREWNDRPLYHDRADNMQLLADAAKKANIPMEEVERFMQEERVRKLRGSLER